MIAEILNTGLIDTIFYINFDTKQISTNNDIFSIITWI